MAATDPAEMQILFHSHVHKSNRQRHDVISVVCNCAGHSE